MDTKFITKTLHHESGTPEVLLPFPRAYVAFGSWPKDAVLAHPQGLRKASMATPTYQTVISLNSNLLSSDS